MKTTLPIAAKAPIPMPIPMPAFVPVPICLGGGEFVDVGVAVALVVAEEVVELDDWVEDVDEAEDEEEDETFFFLPCASTVEFVMLKETLPVRTLFEWESCSQSINWLPFIRS